MPKTAERSNPRSAAAEIGKAIAHPWRTDILTVLHDRPDCGSGLCRQIGVPWVKLGHHVKALLDANAIEVAFKKKVGAHQVIFYRSLTTSTYLPEDLAQLTPEQQGDLFRIILQSITAESLAGLSAGHFVGDPLASAAWDRVSLDPQGYEDLSSSCTAFIRRLHDVAAEADKRMQVSDELPKVYVGAVLGFKRGRTAPATSAAVEDIGGDLFPVALERPTPRESAAAVGKAIAHPTRTDILTVLHEGPAGKSELSKETGVPMGDLGHHIQVLLDAKAIEEAFSESVGNHDVTFFRALTTSTFLPEDLAQLTPEQQHDLFRVILQSITAEALAAFSAGHFEDDPLASAAWDRVSLDGQGYKDLSSSCTAFIRRMHGIADESDKRMKKSGELPTAYVGAVLGFKRSRTEPATSSAVGDVGALGQ